MPAYHFSLPLEVTEVPGRETAGDVRLLPVLEQRSADGDRRYSSVRICPYSGRKVMAAYAPDAYCNRARTVPLCRATPATRTPVCIAPPSWPRDFPASRKRTTPAADPAHLAKASATDRGSRTLCRPATMH